MAARPGESAGIGVAGRRLRITHIITDGYMMGGAQLNTFYSLRYQRQEHSVELVLGTEGPLGDACRAEGIPVVLVPMENTLLSPASDVRALVGLVRHLRMSGPDIAHTHSSKAGALGRVAARIAGIPVIVHTVHGPPFHDRQPAPVRWLIQSIERHLSVWTDKIVTVADAMGDDFVRQGICSRDRLRTIVSGIDVQRLLAVAPGARSLVRSEFGIPHDAVVVVGIGRLSRGKNFDLLLDAATEIRQARSDVYVLIVGEGEERAALHHKIVANGLSGHVVLCGPRGDVGEILTAGDLFVQSSWHEGVSRSLVEAMYVGLPVVATDVVGTREVVREGQTGFLVPPGDARSMTDRIVLLLNDPQRRVEMGRAGQQLVSGKRDIEAMGKGLDTLYRELVKQRVPEREMAQSFSP